MSTAAAGAAAGVGIGGGAGLAHGASGGWGGDFGGERRQFALDFIRGAFFASNLGGVRGDEFLEFIAALRTGIFIDGHVVNLHNQFYIYRRRI